MPEFKTVAKLSDVPEGRGITTRAAGHILALFNIGGKIHALQGLCPHKGGPLGDGYCENGQVYCPLHGWKFDIETGACVDFPDKPAKSFPARIVGDNIEVEL
jgi:nitrite reductase (NADH) small subunit